MQRMSCFRPSPAALFSIDVRSLAALRIGLGVVLLLDLANRARDLGSHYTDFGVLPRSALLAQDTAGRLSLHALSGAMSLQVLLFMVAAVLAVALLLGFRTSLATVGSWAMLVSLHGRNPLVLQGGDTLLRLLLFWSMFLPLGLAWSLDARRTAPGAPLRCIASPATAALLVQVCLVYWFSALFKSWRVWVVEGSALDYALAINQFVTPLGLALRSHTNALRALSPLVFWMELVGPALAFVPVLRAPMRVVLVVSFALLHAGFGLCLALGLFPLISVLGWLPFLPSSFWEWCARRRPAPPPALVLHGSNARGIVAFALLLYVGWWNLATLPEGGIRMPASARRLGRVLRLDQNWSLFAPVPLRNDGWYAVAGRTADGSVVDVLRGTALNWRKPPLVSATYPNQRWRKYLMNLTRKRFAGYRRHFAVYLCRHWNEAPAPRRELRSVRVYFIRERILPGGLSGPPRRVLLARERCGRTRVAPPTATDAAVGRTARRRLGDSAVHGRTRGLAGSMSHSGRVESLTFR